MAKKVSTTPKAAAPAVAPLKRVSIATKVEGAREILVTGDFSGWNGSAVALKPSADGTWTATLSLAPGEYQYRLLVDGHWRDHAEAARRVPNPYGTENCVLTVS